jgi:hypothetical protein
MSDPNPTARFGNNADGTATDDGGQAFPRSGFDLYGSGQQCGMSLRDYFAGQCLANPAICNDDEYYSVIAKQCYDMADAMLEARKD